MKRILYLSLLLLALLVGSNSLYANIEKSTDYTVAVKTAGTKWNEIPVYGCDVSMRQKQRAAFAEFDLASKTLVRVIRHRPVAGPNIIIRPHSKGISYHNINDSTIVFELCHPEYLSIEYGGDRLHNLHLFANPKQSETYTGKEEQTINWTGKSAQDVFVKDARLIYFGPGEHKPKDLPSSDIRIPSNCTVYLAPGAVVKARLIVDHAENVRILGRGMLDHPLRGIEITFSKNVLVDGITVVNPQHYTIFGGQSDSITIRHLKAFSCKSWTDGIDLMSCSNVKVEDVFLRTSDDCIALYNHRWWYWGGSHNIDISHATLWADVAHPVNIGTHGDDRSMTGECLENVNIHDCDILYAYTNAALNISCGDKNTISHVRFDNIRIEDLDSTALIGMKVIFSGKYNRAPGNSVSNVSFNHILFTGNASQLKPCFFEGYDAQREINSVLLKNVLVNGRPIDRSRLNIGRYVEHISLE